jgi:hypothetical protein
MHQGAKYQPACHGKVELPGNFLFNGSIETTTEVYRTKRGEKTYVS